MINSCNIYFPLIIAEPASIVYKINYSYYSEIKILRKLLDSQINHLYEEITQNLNCVKISE